MLRRRKSPRERPQPGEHNEGSTGAPKQARRRPRKREKGPKRGRCARRYLLSAPSHKRGVRAAEESRPVFARSTTDSISGKQSVRLTIPAEAVWDISGEQPLENRTTSHRHEDHRERMKVVRVARVIACRPVPSGMYRAMAPRSGT